MQPVTIHDRTFQFSISVISFTRGIFRDEATRVIIRQLIRAATSIGANITEGQQARSKKEFLQYFHIALRSARETEYWLRLLQKTQAQTQGTLIQECHEIANILAAILLSGQRTHQ